MLRAFPVRGLPPNASTPPDGPAPKSSLGGSSFAQMSVANGHRGWKRHPLGGSIRLGGSPTSGASLRRGPLTRASTTAAARRRDGGAGGRSPRSDPFHHLAGVHDADVIGDLGDHGDVVGDVDDRHPQLGLDLLELLEDLVLDDHVEGGGRFVGDDQLGVARQRHGDGGPLSHSAGELVRVPVHHAGGQTDQFEQLSDPFPPFRFGHLGEVVVQRLTI